jgi:hypothetical protein
VSDDSFQGSATRGRFLSRGLNQYLV